MPPRPTVRVLAGEGPAQIAARVVGDARRWRELVAANPSKRTRSDGTFVQLSPGEMLFLPPTWPSPTPHVDEPAIAAAAPTGTDAELTWARNQTRWLPDVFFLELAAVARRENIRDPLFLVDVLIKESGLRGSAHADRKGDDGEMHTVAWGLNQITKIAAGAVGLTPEQLPALLTMPETQQLVHTERYLRSQRNARGNRPYTTAAQVYQAWFAPARMKLGDGDSVVLYSRAEHPREYRANDYLDNYGTGLPPKGAITQGDLGRWVASATKSDLHKAVAIRMRAMGVEGPTPNGFIVLRLLATLAAAGAVGAAVLYATR